MIPANFTVNLTAPDQGHVGYGVGNALPHLKDVRLVFDKSVFEALAEAVHNEHPHMTPAERVEDIQAFGRELRSNRLKALHFLQEAGILDDDGELAEPYRL